MIFLPQDWLGPGRRPRRRLSGDSYLLTDIGAAAAARQMLDWGEPLSLFNDSKCHSDLLLL